VKFKGERRYLYSSLIPYAITISGNSARTAFAAAFMRSSARRSFGFSKAYLFENLAVHQNQSSISRSRRDALVESSSVDSHHDPRVWEEQVGLLEGLYVFIPESC
jgi:hypothetical protein